MNLTNRSTEIVRALLEFEDDDIGDMKDLEGEPPVPKKLPLGTISHGTMREEDLIPAFLDVLKSVDPAKEAQVMSEYPIDIEDNDTEFCFGTLFDILDGYTLPYTYFGSHPGDGSDYGVWVSTEAIDNALEYEETDELQAMHPGEDFPKGSKYVVVMNQQGEYTELLDGSTGHTIWSE